MGGVYTLLRLLVCSKDTDKARGIYHKAMDILKALKLKCEISCTNSATAFAEGKNPRNKPYDILILDSEDEACVNLAAQIRSKNLIVSIIFFNLSEDKDLRNVLRYRPSYATLRCEDNSDLEQALKWCCAEQLRARPYFSVKNKDVQMRIEHSNISYFESRQRIVIMHTPQQAIEFYAKLSDVEAALPPDSFVRCHQSYIVNMNYIKTLDKANRLFVLNSGITIEISKSQYSHAIAEYERFSLSSGI